VTETDQLLLFLATTRMAHLVLAESRDYELVWFERLGGKTPKGVAEDAKWFALDYSDGTGNEELVLEHILKERMIESKYEGYKGFYKVSEFGRAFALGAAGNVVLAR
jgi:hypothetical protein